MKTTLITTITLAVGLVAGNSVFAGGKGGNGSHGSHSSYHSSGSHVSQSMHNTTHYTKPITSYHKTSNYQNTKPITNYHKTGTYHNYHLTHGKQFSKGIYYPGKYHKHWSYCCFNNNYGCYLYCCPCTNCWYYWCVPDCCYYPVCYVPYGCYCWGTPVAYFTVVLPPAEVIVPDPVVTLSPDGE
jgi:hypothetical protein